MVEQGECVCNGDKVSAWDDEKVLEVDAGDGCTTCERASGRRAAPVTGVRLADFMLWVFYYN